MSKLEAAVLIAALGLIWIAVTGIWVDVAWTVLKP